jgi:hypothetical protein
MHVASCFELIGGGQSSGINMQHSTKQSGGQSSGINDSLAASLEKRQNELMKTVNNQLIEQRTNSLINFLSLATLKPRFLTQLLHMYMFIYISKTLLYVNPL